jgi:hypothetical protein
MEQGFALYPIWDNTITGHTKNSLDLNRIRLRSKITIITRSNNRNRI